MIKIVINRGVGFGLSHAAIMRYAELKGITISPYKYDNAIKLFVKIDMATYDSNRSPDYFMCNEATILCDRKVMDTSFFSEHKLLRNDPFLVQTVEELGKRANTIMSELKVIEIPDDVRWYIDEDEMGPEKVREKARSWD